MPKRRISLYALTAALLAGTAAVAAPSSAFAAPATYADVGGNAYLNTQVNLPPGVWTDTPLQVVLPSAGTYELDANVRGRLAGSPLLNTYITARLWDASTGTALPQSERIVYQIIDINPGTAQTGGNATAPISELISVGEPTTIELQARHIDAVGTADIAQIYSDDQGYTSLRFERIGP